MQLLDGKLLSQQILDDLRADIIKFSSPPRLDIILVGDNPSSLKYVDLKLKRAGEIGVKVILHKLPTPTTQSDLIALIDQLNTNEEVAGFFVQLPLPPHLDRTTVLNAIDPSKDVDGLTAINLGRLFHQDPQAVTPATPQAITALLKHYHIDISGKSAVIINHSTLIGSPLSALLLAQKATVTICHEFTPNLAQITSQADILISATGVKNLITPNHVKNNAVVIDVGSGDVDFAQVSPKCSFITPTFGGVGPMTVAMLLQNLITLITK